MNTTQMNKTYRGTVVTLPARQKGMTLIGFVFVLAFLLSIAYMGMKIVPVYMSYFSVVDAIESVAMEPGINRHSVATIKGKLSKRLYVNYAEGLTPDSIKVVRTRNGKEIQLDYEVREHIVGNIDVCIAFNKVVVLNRSG